MKKYLRVFRNRHPNCDGTPWGWVEDEQERSIVTWSGVKAEMVAKVLVDRYNKDVSQSSDTESDEEFQKRINGLSWNGDE